jgi:hypothetical protein
MHPTPHFHSHYLASSSSFHPEPEEILPSSLTYLNNEALLNLYSRVALGVRTEPVHSPTAARLKLATGILVLVPVSADVGRWGNYLLLALCKHFQVDT